MSKAVLTLDSTKGAPPGSGFLATKLHPRSARSSLVARSRVTIFLEDGLSTNLILVSAPVGFGKTTALTDWLGDRPEGYC